ncbi:MAG: hypothetical protein KFF50_03520 [Desulfatitalea sp.]|nr:hypothetical protein [Desulfatitalea sp.]
MSDEKPAGSVSKEILAAFDTMWGLHPSPVLLVRADREIIAVNQEGANLGIPLGIKCFQLSGKKKVCEGCLANEALRDHTGKRAGAWQANLNMFTDGYWIPVKGAENLYVHFGNDITSYVREELCR